MSKPPLLVSACLLGRACRYDGSSVPFPFAAYLEEHYTLIPVCPEQLGGLPTPRPSAELIKGSVFTATGEDLTKAFKMGAERSLALAVKAGCKQALLMERSPSCGYGQVYDGTFSGVLTTGDGIFAKMLILEGFEISTPSKLLLFR
ncbi:MAG: DUF523 domain-containing protein [Sphaerochaeta sp.]